MNIDLQELLLSAIAGILIGSYLVHKNIIILKLERTYYENLVNKIINHSPVKGNYNLYDQNNRYLHHTNKDYQPLILKAHELNPGYYTVGNPSLTESFTLSLILYNKTTKDTKTYLIRKD